MSPPTVTVRGEGQAEGPPELAAVSAVLHTAGRTAAEVTASLADIVRAVDAARPDLVYTAVRTEPLQVSPVFDRRSPMRVTGYRGRYATRLELADFDRLDRVVVALAGLPGSEVTGPEWSLRPHSPLHRAARLAAVDDALRRARDYATALHAGLGDLLELSEVDSGFGGSPRAYAMARGTEEPTFDFEPQPQTVSARVTARFELRDLPAVDPPS